MRQVESENLEFKREFSETSAFAEAKIEFGDAQQKTLGLIAEDGTYTNLALLLSDQCPFTNKIAVWGDDSKMSFRDRLETTGSLRCLPRGNPSTGRMCKMLWESLL